MSQARILFGRVIHSRRRPARNAFAYPVFFLRVPLSGMAGAGRGIFSVDRWNLLSLMRRDHGPRDGTALEPWVRGQLARAGIRGADGEILLQAFPRVLGFVFNPIAVFYCRDREGALRAVLCEVANTFGERHNYLLAHADGRAIAPRDWLRADKVFHVSPFCEVAGNALRWSYVLDAKREDGGTIHLDMDDWMWLVDERTLVNKTAFSKFGIKFGEVTIFFRKPGA